MNRRPLKDTGESPSEVGTAKQSWKVLSKLTVGLFFFFSIILFIGNNESFAGSYDGKENSILFYNPADSEVSHSFKITPLLSTYECGAMSLNPKCRSSKGARPSSAPLGEFTAYKSCYTDDNDDERSQTIITLNPGEHHVLPLNKSKKSDCDGLPAWVFVQMVSHEEHTYAPRIPQKDDVCNQSKREPRVYCMVLKITGKGEVNTEKVKTTYKSSDSFNKDNFEWAPYRYARNKFYSTRDPKNRHKDGNRMTVTPIFGINYKRNDPNVTSTFSEEGISPTPCNNILQASGRHVGHCITLPRGVINSVTARWEHYGTLTWLKQVKNMEAIEVKTETAATKDTTDTSNYSVGFEYAYQNGVKDVSSHTFKASVGHSWGSSVKTGVKQAKSVTIKLDWGKAFNTNTSGGKDYSDAFRNANLAQGCKLIGEESTRQTVDCKSHGKELIDWHLFGYQMSGVDSRGTYTLNLPPELLSYAITSTLIPILCTSDLRKPTNNNEPCVPDFDIGMQEYDSHWTMYENCCSADDVMVKHGTSTAPTPRTATSRRLLTTPNSTGGEHQAPKRRLKHREKRKRVSSH